MNEIIPQSPVRGFDFDDENSYVPETPQSVASPRTYNAIPIPSLTRIRRALGVLDSSPPRTPPQVTPSLRQCCEKSLSDKKKVPRCENCLLDNLHVFKKVRVSLFHDKHKEKENDKHKEKENDKHKEKENDKHKEKENDKHKEKENDKHKEKENAQVKIEIKNEFSINTEAFYGSSGDEELKFFPSAPVDVKPVITQSTKMKPIRTLPSKASVQQPIKRRSTGEINRGVGHGIKKPKNNKNPNNSSDDVKKKISLKQEVIVKKEPNKRLEDDDSEYEKIPIYDPTKKFFKCKYVTRLKSKLIETLEDIQDVSDSASENNINEDNNCETIPNSPDSKTKIYNVNRTVECSTKFSLEKFQTDPINVPTNKSYPVNVPTNCQIKKFDAERDNLIYPNVCSTYQNYNRKSSNLHERKNFNFNDADKNTPTHQNHVHLLNFNQDNVIENIIAEKECTKNNEKGSIEDKQSRNKTEKGGENLQSTVVNKTRYLINAKEDNFNSAECKECQQYNLIYKFSNENNEDIHTKYHDSFQNLKFQEWRNQQFIFEESGTKTKVILIKSDDYVFYQTKLKKLLNLCAEEMNISDCDTLIKNKNSKVYLLVKHNIIVSILVAGITIIQDNILSKPNVMFGINFIWTAKSFRRQKIASKLIDVMRSNFDYDYRIAIDRIAFSKHFLTPDGKAFAASYTKSSTLKVF